MLQNYTINITPTAKFPKFSIKNTSFFQSGGQIPDFNKVFVMVMLSLTFSFSLSLTLTFSLNLLSHIRHLPAQHRAQDHLNILHERIVPIIIAVQPHLVRVYHIVVVPHRHLLVAHPDNLLLRQHLPHHHADEKVQIASPSGKPSPAP